MPRPRSVHGIQLEGEGAPLGSVAPRVIANTEVTNSNGKRLKTTQKDPAKRSSKHAPVEVSSKKPVTRRRTVVEVPTARQKSRDPRFLPMAGEFSAQKFNNNYGFLKDFHTNELTTLKDSLKRARKRLESASRDLRPQYEEEIEKLNLAVKRAESAVNKDRREHTESEAMRRVVADERQKRQQGKGAWWLKRSDKKSLLMRARYEALVATGKGAVKKAIEKKQKKLGQKEKRSRPFGRGQARDDTGNAESKKRRLASGSHTEPGKRRRVG